MEIPRLMRMPETIQEYTDFAQYLSKLDHAVCYRVTRMMARTDLYFLLRYMCKRHDMEHPWLIARCKEVYNEPDGMLDLWSREHYKSTIITFGLTLQDIIASHGDDPLPKWGGIEPVFGIFSCTRPIAKGFLRQIKREFEQNKLLMQFFPDVIWENPKEAPKWSEDDGLVLKRRSNPKESTVEAWGLVEGQPTGKHFDVQVYDDVVTLESVRSPDMMRKTLESWEMSVNLGGGNVRRRHIGTRYHFNDTYREIMKREGAKPRIYPGTDDGTPTGNPLLKTKEWMKERYQLLGQYTFSTQILQNPLADEAHVLPIEWIRYYEGVPEFAAIGCNIYMLVDPASEKKKTSDYTSIWVVGCGEDKKYRVLDLVRDRLNLAERGDAVMKLHRKWKPLGVGYEKYGMQADIEYIKERQSRENYYFEITPLGGIVPKMDRIRRLVPSLEEARWLFPPSLHKKCTDGQIRNLVDVYIREEYTAFPVPVHDDMLDCQSRILENDMNVLWPGTGEYDQQERYSGRKQPRTTAWSA